MSTVVTYNPFGRHQRVISWMFESQLVALTIEEILPKINAPGRGLKVPVNLTRMSEWGARTTFSETGD